MPPVPQDSDCQLVNVPSFFAATFTLANAEGRAPATSSSEFLSSISFTGLPLSLASRAVSMAQRSAANLLPNPAPMYWQMMSTLFGEIPKGSANCWPMAETPCVEAQAVMLCGSVHSTTFPCDSRQQWVMTGMP